jgi:hypothetical protein
MKKLLITSATLFLFSASIFMFQISCSKNSSTATNNTNSGQGKVMCSYKTRVLSIFDYNKIETPISVSNSIGLFESDGKNIWMVNSYTSSNNTYYSLFLCDMNGQNYKTLLSGANWIRSISKIKNEEKILVDCADSILIVDKNKNITKINKVDKNSIAKTDGYNIWYNSGNTFYISDLDGKNYRKVASVTKSRGYSTILNNEKIICVSDDYAFTILDKNGDKTIVTIFDKIYSSGYMNADGYISNGEKIWFKSLIKLTSTTTGLNLLQYDINTKKTDTLLYSNFSSTSELITF